MGNASPFPSHSTSTVFFSEMEGTAAGWSSIVLDGMKNLRSRGALADVSLVANDGTAVEAHSLVLCSSSEHFKEVSSHLPTEK